jgi:diaminohydroxyphosphoribosylaminopyrimidine deaminase/5-amino-6-(5-phosphoribosylamino)uracil reductase
MLPAGASRADIKPAFMRQAIYAAQKAEGRTAPNPMVGCVIVRCGEVVGVGLHERAGQPHAEVVALGAAGTLAKGADVYVTLEPCHHTGRTGPCTEALLRAGVRRVIIGARDPNPLVDGRGIAALRAAGVVVVTGVLRQACSAINEAFNHAIVTRRAFGVAKLAQSADGCVASRTGASKWITGEAARADGHRLRNIVDAIVVGSGTVLADDPRLTCRTPGGRDPCRVVLDARARTPASAQVIQAARTSAASTIVCVGPAADPKACRDIEAAGAQIWRCPPSPQATAGLDVRFVAEQLFSAGVLSMLIEGGPKVQGAFFDAQLIERVVVYVAPMLLGGLGATRSLAGIGPDSLAAAPRIVRPHWRKMGADMRLSGRIAYLPERPEEPS